MTTTTDATMCPSQRRYALARALYETAIASAHREAPDAPRGASAEDSLAADARYDAARERHNVDGLALALRAAEVAMVEDRCKALARVYPAQASTIRETREMAARSATHWARIVDLCFRGCVEVPA
jgi:hypothetical protein